MHAVVLAADDPARAAGAVVGRLLFPVLGIVLLVLGQRRRRDASTSSRGTGLIVAGAVILTLSVLGLLGSLASTATGS